MQQFYKTFIDIFFLTLFSTISSFAQVAETTLLGQLTYEVEGSDIWGYVADGREYALMTTQTGVSIVEVSDPKQPTEVQFIAGPFTDWRDIKTWGTYAYIINESSEGLQIIDLSQLPDTVHTTNWTLGTWQNQSIVLETAHNIFIDEKGIAYLLGYNNSFGALMLDVNTNPTQPTIVGIYGERGNHYIHDAYVRNDTMWAAELYNGYVAVVDITDKSNPIVLATQPTPHDFTHHVWLNDAGTTLFTADEKSDAFIVSYDVSDLSDIKELDRYQSSPGQNVIPHNVFTHSPNPNHTFLVISYYRDGIKIVDATYPYNLIEVGHYDTSPLSGSNFNGAWGAYPYLPSGHILASDIESGLFVIGVDYQAAAYLEGVVRDSTTATALSGVDVRLVVDKNAQTYTTDFSGRFAVGTAHADTYQLQVFKYGYAEKTVTVDLINGELTDITVDLVPLTAFELQINVRNRATDEKLAHIPVRIEHAEDAFELMTDEEGKAHLSLFYPDEYQIQVGQWGFRSLATNQRLSESVTVDIALAPQYYDDFLFDMGWTISGPANAGIWERAIPTGSSFLGMQITPPTDFPNDIGRYCYVTGNEFTLSDNVDQTTILQSPFFDVTAFDSLVINYQRWFFTQEGSDDVFTTHLTNGIDTILLALVTATDLAMNQWVEHHIGISNNELRFTEQMQLLFEATDFKENGNHLTELAIDVVALQTFVAAPKANFSAVSEPSGCVPFTLTLANQSEGKGIENRWLIENGAIIQQSQDSIVITYEQAGNYSPTLIVSNNGGTDTLTLMDYVTVYPKPKVNIQSNSENNSICSNESIILYAPKEANSVYEWQLPNQTILTADSLIIQPNQTSTYQLMAINKTGCRAEDSITITVYSRPFVDIRSNSESNDICNNELITLYTPKEMNVNYEWQLPNQEIVTADSLVLQPNQTSTYQLRAINEMGCRAENSITITVHSRPSADIQSNSENNSICAAESIVLYTPKEANIQYEWQLPNQEFVIADSLVLQPNQTSQYQLIATNETGCRTEENITITVHPLPLFTLQSSALSACAIQGDTIELRITPEAETYSYDWEASTINVLADGLMAHFIPSDGHTQYRVTAINEQGCSTILEGEIALEEIITLDFSIDNTTICAGDDLTINNLSSSNADYNWQLVHQASTETLFSEAFNPTFNLKEAGNYLLTVGSNQCYDLDHTPTQMITVALNPQIQLSSNIDTACVEGIVQLSVHTISEENLQFVWPNNDVVESRDNGINIRSTTAGLKTYNVTAINEMGCKTKAEIPIWFENCVTDIAALTTPPPFSIYPNPNNGQFWIQLSNANPQPTNISLFNTLGQSVTTNLQLLNTQVYQINDLSSGLYYIVIELENKKMMQKIIVN